MGFALVWLFQGPCACWKTFLSTPLPHSLHCLPTSPCPAVHIPAWLLASFTVQLGEAGMAVSIHLILFLFLPLWLPSSEQSQTLPPQTSPSPALKGGFLPSTHPTAWDESSADKPCKPRPPAAAAKMLAACILGWEPQQQEQQHFGESNDTQRAETVCNKDCGRGKESSIRLYFGALQLSIPTGPSSSLKSFPPPLCSLFMFTCYPINSPFSCAPAMVLSSDHCTGAINPLDCIRLWKIPIWTAGAFICE